MSGHPKFLDGFHESVTVLVRDLSGGLPARAAAQHVEDDVLPDEDEVALDLLVELVRNFHAAYVVWARFGPLSADLTRLDDLRDELEDFVGDANPVEEAAHHVLGRVPPSYVQLPK